MKLIDSNLKHNCELWTAETNKRSNRFVCKYYQILSASIAQINVLNAAYCAQLLAREMRLYRRWTVSYCDETGTDFFVFFHVKDR